jgi:hypothetical protein
MPKMYLSMYHPFLNFRMGGSQYLEARILGENINFQKKYRKIPTREVSKYIEVHFLNVVTPYLNICGNVSFFFEKHPIWWEGVL